MSWDDKETVIRKTLRGEGCKCPPNLQWIKRAIEGVIHLNSLGITAVVGSKFIKEMEAHKNELRFKEAP